MKTFLISTITVLVFLVILMIFISYQDYKKENIYKIPSKDSDLLEGDILVVRKNKKGNQYVQKATTNNVQQYLDSIE